MNLINKLTIKNLKLNKKRTIVTIIGIILSVALITAVASMVVSFRSSLIVFEKTMRGNYHYGFKNVSSTDLTYFKDNRNIENYYITKYIGYAPIIESKNEYKPYAFIMAFDKSALSNTGLTLLEGRMPENSNEIVIPRHLKNNGRVTYKIGSTISLDIGKRLAGNDELDQNNSFVLDEENFKKEYTKEYKVVGIVERPSGNIEPYTAPGYTFITLLDEDYSKGIYNVYTRYTKKGINNKDKVTANILGIDEKIYTSGRNGDLTNAYFDELKKAKYQLIENTTLIRLESFSIKDNTMQVLYNLAAIVIIIIVVTSVFCIKNSFEISITEKIKQYGMLRSIGATGKQIKKNVLYEGLILSFIGIPLGLLSGIFASYILIQVTNYFLSNGLELKLIYKTSFIAILLSILISLITIYFSARKSAKKASRVSPINAIRNSDGIKIKSKKMHTPYLIKKVFGIGGVISYKNLKRSSKKYRTTVISIIVCVSVFIGLTSFIDIGFRVIKTKYGEVSYNISINMNNDRNKVNEILSYDGIKRFSYIRNKSALIAKPLLNKEYYELNSYYDSDGNKLPIDKVENYNITIASLGDEEYKRYINKLGLNYDESKDKYILINNTFETKTVKGKAKSVELSMLDYKDNDSIKVAINNNNNDTNNEQTKLYNDISIIKVTSIRPLGYENTYGRPLFIVSDEYMNSLLEEKYAVLNIDSTNPDKLQDDVEKLLKDSKYNIYNLDKEENMLQSYYTLMAIFLYGFITVIALIGVTSIFNTITTNVELRSREFAMLKSIGMTKKEFNRMIRLESLFYGTKSLIIGIPIGILISYFIYNIFGGMNLIIKYTLPIKGIIISILVVFILITVIMKYSVNKINKQNTIETIRNENI